MTRRQLHVAPDPVLRDGIYIRVSAIMGRTDDRFLSPDIQRQSIDRARTHGPTSRVIEEWRDIDISTARYAIADRPGLQAALTAAREHRIDRLWFLVLDRFDRDTSALKAFDEIAQLGIELWTENGRVDIETPEGYLSTTMQLAIARYQRDRIGKAWKQTHEHRISRGLSHSGKARWGYTYDRTQSLHIPDPTTSPILADLYQRYIDGETIYSLIRWLNAEGHTTSTGAPWTDRTLRRLLDSGFAAGHLTFNDTTHPGAHQPLIDQDTWNAYLAARHSRRRASNQERSQYVLSGLVRCSCGSSMTAGQFGAGRTPKYRCKAAKEEGRHPGGYVMADYLERAVQDWLAGLAEEADAAIDLALAVERKTSSHRADGERLAREIEKIDGQLVRLTKHLASGLIPEDTYAKTRDDLTAERAQFAERLAELRIREGAVRPERPYAVAGALIRDWDVLPVTSRREALRRLIARIEVSPGRPRARITIIPTWE